MVEELKKIRVLYLYKHKRSFVYRDFDFLKKYFTVKDGFFSLKKILFLPMWISKSDVVFIWFAGFHAFIGTIFARLFSKKVVVVTGGYDVAGEKEINYGLMLNPFLKLMVNFVLKRSNKILAVSHFNKKEIEKHLGIKENVEMIYNSVDAEKYYPKGKKDNSIATVGFISWDNVKRKGLDTFVKAAKFLPDVKFLVVGNASDNSIDYLKSLADKNVSFTGFVSDDELLKIYQKAKVYCQLSYYESFGMTPAEAMLCECIPVVTKRGALPEVAGDTGAFAEYNNDKSTAIAIEKALKLKKGKEARERIKKLFPTESREKKLRETIECLKE